MKSCRDRFVGKSVPFFLSLSVLSWAAASVTADPIVPGTGTRIAYDDLEDPSWSYELNLPKASSNIDNQERQPGGSSATASGTRVRFAASRISSNASRRRPAELPGSKGSMLAQNAQFGRALLPNEQVSAGRSRFNASMTTGGYNLAVAHAERRRARLFAPLRAMGKADRHVVRNPGPT